MLDFIADVVDIVVDVWCYKTSKREEQEEEESKKSIMLQTTKEEDAHKMEKQKRIRHMGKGFQVFHTVMDVIKMKDT